MDKSYGKANRYARFLARLRGSLDYHPPDRIVNAVSDSIRESCERIDQLPSDVDPIAQQIVEGEVERIEDLLGVAFILYQRPITFILSNIIQLHDQAERDGKTLSVIKKEKRGKMKRNLMRYKVAGPLQTLFSEIEVIDAFANYYKHCDEWDCVNDKNETTIKIIDFVDPSPPATPSDRGLPLYLVNRSFRRAAEYLGNPEFHNISVVGHKITQWGKDLAIVYEEELKKEGLL